MGRCCRKLSVPSWTRMTSINFEAVAPSSVGCKHATNEDIASASPWPEAPLASRALSSEGWAEGARQGWGGRGGGGWRAGCWRLPRVWERKLSPGVSMSCWALKAGDLAGGFSVWPRAKIASLVTVCAQLPRLSKQPLTPAHCWLTVTCLQVQMTVCVPRVGGRAPTILFSLSSCSLRAGSGATELAEGETLTPRARGPSSDGRERCCPPPQVSPWTREKSTLASRSRMRTIWTPEWLYLATEN